jgi:hypothetical protein
MEKAKPDVIINLDKPRKLRFDLNAMVAFEQSTGKNLFNDNVFQSKMSIADIRALLWACLQGDFQDNEELTEKDVGALVTMDNLMEVSTQLGKAFQLAMPGLSKDNGDPLAEKPQEKPQNG